MNFHPLQVQNARITLSQNNCVSSAFLDNKGGGFSLIILCCYGCVSYKIKVLCVCMYVLVCVCLLEVCVRVLYVGVRFFVIVLLVCLCVYMCYSS